MYLPRLPSPGANQASQVSLTQENPTQVQAEVYMAKVKKAGCLESTAQAIWVPISLFLSSLFEIFYFQLPRGSSPFLVRIPPRAPVPDPLERVIVRLKRWGPGMWEGWAIPRVLTAREAMREVSGLCHQGRGLVWSDFSRCDLCTRKNCENA